MKDLTQYINEAKTDPNTDQEEFVMDSPHLHKGRTDFLRMVYGNKITLYHGTNTTFKKFDKKKSRTVRNEHFFGDGVFLTPSFIVAHRYANANINNMLTTDIIKKAKKVSKELYDFMHGLYKNGKSTWTDGTVQRFEKKHGDDINGVDLNEISDLVQLIPNAQITKDYEEGSEKGLEIGDLFNSSPSALSEWDIDNIQKLGLGDYRARVLSVDVETKGASIFFTDDPKKAKKSKADFIVIYNHDELLDGVAELKVNDTKRLKIVGTDFDV